MAAGPGLPAGALVHFALAALCLFLATLQLALWRAIPKDRLPLWTALCLGGLGMLNLSVAGGGEATAGAFGRPAAWLAVSGLAPIGFPGAMLTIWHILGVPLNRPRRVWLGALVVAAMLVFTANVMFVTNHWNDPSATWQMMDTDDDLGFLEFVPNFAGSSISFVALFEALLALRRKNRMGWAVLGTTSITIPLGILQSTVGSAGGVVFIPLVGLPLLLLATLVLITRFRVAIGRSEAAGGYRLIRRLASGGMGELHLASRVGPGGFERPVALKRVLVRPDDLGIDARAVERLLSEARMAAKLVHPNIVAVHDVGRIEGTEGFGWFIAMEYLPGVDMKAVRDAANVLEVRLSPEFVATIAREVCKGLAHAHDHGIVHRDVSPHNVMVTFDGAVKLVDFGVAVQGGNTKLDQTGYVLGKIGYASPEQLRGTAIGPASDLFSLGVLMYELLAGARPFQGETAMDTASKVLRGERSPLSTRRAELPDALVDVVESALAVQAEKRFASARDMGAALASVLSKLPHCDPGTVARSLCGTDVKQHAAAVEEAATLGIRTTNPGTTPAAPDRSALERR